MEAKCVRLNARLDLRCYGCRNNNCRPQLARPVHSLLQERGKYPARQTGLFPTAVDVRCRNHERDGSERDDTSICQRDERGSCALWQRVELVSDLLLHRLRYIHSAIANAPDKAASFTVATVR